MPDSAAKIVKIRTYLKEHKLEGVVLSTRANFAWVTGGGDNHVVSQSESGAAAIVVTPKQVIVVADAIEAPRIEKEEPINGSTVKVHPWAMPLGEAVGKAVGKKALAADEPTRMGLPPLPGDFNDEVRAELVEADLRAYRQLGRDCSLAIETVARHVSVGDSGQQVEAELARHLLVRGIQPYVLLVGFDERLLRYRHPTPSANHLRHYAMLVVCGQRKGLIANLTRFIHFGPVPADLLAKHEACCRVEAALWEATKPGVPWKAAFKAGQDAYKKEGFDKEWELHHQGGPTGFSGRDFMAHAGEERLVRDHQAVAWNPSIQGTKSEDTFVILGDQREVLTACSGNWPTLTVKTPSGQPLVRPAILVR